MTFFRPFGNAGFEQLEDLVSPILDLRILNDPQKMAELTGETHVIDCIDGGSRSSVVNNHGIVEPATFTVLAVVTEFENCQISNQNFNGRVSIGYELVNNATGHPIQYFVSYHDFQFIEHNRWLNYNGMEAHSSESSCQSSGSVFSTLLIEDVVTGEQILFDHTQTRNLSLSRSDCDVAPFHRPEQFEGELFLSDYGYVVLSGYNQFTYTYAAELDSFATETLPQGGEFVIGGRGDRNAAIIDFSETSVSVSIGNIWSAGFDVKFESRQQLNVAENGGLEDLSDSDGDTMINSWELYYGLDPNDPLDAEFDMDNDGLSNLIEYLTLGNPYSPDL